MNTSTEMKNVSEKTSSTNVSGFKSDKDKMYSLQGFVNKINKSDMNTFGNYFVDFSDMFQETTDYQGYMKKNVSLFNNDPTEKKQIKNISSNFYLKPQYFGKFSNETLFYIFYYMPKDTLQLFASEELCKRKWRYNTDYSLWFISESSMDNEKSDKGDSFMYFNPNEWKMMKYTFGPLNAKAFLAENEIFKYNKQLNIDK